MDSKLEPIEDELRVTMIDILRKCQSIVADNFRSLTKRGKIVNAAPETHAVHQDEDTTQYVYPRAITNIDTESVNMTLPTATYFREPPFYDMSFGVPETPKKQGESTNTPVSNDSGFDSTVHTGYDLLLNQTLPENMATSNTAPHNRAVEGYAPDGSWGVPSCNYGKEVPPTGNAHTDHIDAIFEQIYAVEASVDDDLFQPILRTSQD